MTTKLTLSMNAETIKKAKARARARAQHTSLSGLVECYFESLVSKSADIPTILPKTHSANAKKTIQNRR